MDYQLLSVGNIKKSTFVVRKNKITVQFLKSIVVVMKLAANARKKRLLAIAKSLRRSSLAALNRAMNKCCVWEKN